MKKNKTTNNQQADTFSDSRRQQMDKRSAQVSETNSDMDSSTSKYAVQNDDRERRDGPGGN